MSEATLIERFRSNSIGRQLALVAGIGLALALVLGTAWYFFLRTPYVPLFNGLSAPDAAAVVSELERQKRSYRLANKGTTILVPSDEADSAYLSVMSEDLPLKGTVGFELFNKSDMGLTDFAQKINFQRALQGELARTIMTFDGVDTARVHLSLGEDRIFREDRVKPTASVTIRMVDGQRLSQTAAYGIQRMVAAAVPQLDLENVVILDRTAAIIGETQISESLQVQNTKPIDELSVIESFYETRIHAFLSDRGYSDSTVEEVTAYITRANDPEFDRSAGWTSEDRDFPLSVRVMSGPLPAGTSTDSIKEIVASAIGSNASRADMIVVDPYKNIHTDDANVPEDSAVVLAAGEPESRYPSSLFSQPGSTGILFIILPVLAAALAAFALLRRRRRSIASRDAFVLQLQDLLKQEQGGDQHAA